MNDSLKSALFDDGDELLEHRERGFSVDRKKMFEKLSTRRTVDNQTAYIIDLIDFAMQNNKGSVAITAKPKRFELSIDGVGVTRSQLDATLALAYQPINDKRFTKILGLARGISAGLGNKHLDHIYIDTRHESEDEGYACKIDNILEGEFKPAEAKSTLDRPGFTISVKRRKADRAQSRGRTRLGRLLSPSWVQPSVEYGRLKGMHFYTDVDITLNGEKISSPYAIEDASIVHTFKKDGVEGIVGIPAQRFDSDGSRMRAGEVTLVRNGIMRQRLRSHDLGEMLLSTDISAIASSGLFSMDLSGSHLVKDARYESILRSLGEEILVMYQKLCDRYARRAEEVYREVELVNRHEYGRNPPFFIGCSDLTKGTRVKEALLEDDRRNILDFVSKNIAAEELLKDAASPDFALPALSKLPLFIHLTPTEQPSGLRSFFKQSSYSRLRPALVTLEDVLKALREGKTLSWRDEDCRFTEVGNNDYLVGEDAFGKPILEALAKEHACARTEVQPRETPGLLRSLYRQISSRRTKAKETEQVSASPAKKGGSIARTVVAGAAGAVAVGGLGIGALYAAGGIASAASVLAAGAQEYILYYLSAAGLAGGGAILHKTTALFTERNGRQAIIPRAYDSLEDKLVGVEKTLEAHSILLQCKVINPIRRFAYEQLAYGKRAIWAGTKATAKGIRFGAYYGAKGAATGIVGGVGLAGAGGYLLYKYMLTPLGHGISWGAKNLVATPIAYTLWGGGGALCATGRGIRWVAAPPLRATADALGKCCSRVDRYFGAHLERRREHKRLRKTRQRERTAALEQQQSYSLLQDSIRVTSWLEEVINDNAEFLGEAMCSVSAKLSAWSITKTPPDLSEGHREMRIGVVPVYLTGRADAKHPLHLLFLDGSDHNYLKKEMSRKSFRSGMHRLQVIQYVDDLWNRFNAAQLGRSEQLLPYSGSPVYGGLAFIVNMASPLVQRWAAEPRATVALYQNMFLETLRELEDKGLKMRWGITTPVETYYEEVETHRGTNLISREQRYDNSEVVASRLRNYTSMLQTKLSEAAVHDLVRAYEQNTAPGDFETQYSKLGSKERAKFIEHIYAMPPNPRLTAVVERLDLPLVEEVGRRIVN